MRASNTFRAESVCGRSVATTMSSARIASVTTVPIARAGTSGIETARSVASSTRVTPQENDLVVYQNVEIHMSELFVQQNARLTVQADPLDLVFIEK